MRSRGRRATLEESGGAVGETARNGGHGGSMGVAAEEHGDAAKRLVALPECFRFVNERIRELGSVRGDELTLVCECDDVGCTGVLRMGERDYEALRSAPGRYAVLPGHDRSMMGAVVDRTPAYILVQARDIGGKR